MKRNGLILLATLGSAGLLLGAFGFQHIGGLAPCKMCLWQRWPHAAAVVIGAVLLVGGPRVLAWLGALAALTTGLIGAYHAGVEWGFWPGPSSCTGGGMDMGGMAGWNAIAAFGLTAIWIKAARTA